MKFKKLTPNFSVRNVKESVRFYQDILGFKLEIVVPNGTNAIEKEISEDKEYSTAMMRKDEVFVMFLQHDYVEKTTPLLEATSERAPVLFYVDISGIDELYTGLKGKVAIEKEIETTWYGMREFYIKDCNGYLLGFGERA